MRSAIDGLPWQGTQFSILIENTAGAECSLGGSFDQVAELVMLLRNHAPVAVCLDTCHTHVAGYDIVSDEGYEDTMTQIEATVGFDAVSRVALQRRQGGAGIEAGPASAYWAGNHRQQAVPAAAPR